MEPPQFMAYHVGMKELIELPQPRRWAERITQAEFATCAPEKLELVDGNVLASEKARLTLLALLLKNCGVEAAAFLTNEDDWREATEHAFSKTFE
jgi:hypothetical protein